MSVSLITLTNLVGTFIAKKFDWQISQIELMTVSGVIIGFLSSVNIDFIKTYINFWYVSLGFSSVLIIFLIILYKKRISKPSRPTITISSMYLDVVNFYIQKNMSFYKNDHFIVGDDIIRDGCFGNPDFASNKNIYFNDTNYNVSGILRFGTGVRKTLNRDSDGDVITSETPFRNLTIEIFGGNLSPAEYYLKILEYKRINTAAINIFYYKYLPRVTNNFHCVKLYSGPVLSKKVAYEKYIKPYFSPNKNEIWERCHKIQYNSSEMIDMGQPARCNYLFYGPPGSGKSSFISRIGLALDRHIMSVDLTQCKTKRDAYEIIQSPRTEGFGFLDPNQYIIILEEFDNTVKFLNQRKNEIIKDEKGNIQPVSTDEFKLEDLLELLAGPVEITGSMIFATTNHYEEIFKILPALFRAGRLTPVFFDNLNYESLQEMSEYHFGSRLSFQFDRCPIPTSEVVEKIISCKMVENGFQKFETEMEKLFHRHSM